MINSRWSENPTSFPHFLPQELVSTMFCLSCSKEHCVLLFHEQEKRQIRSDWTDHRLLQWGTCEPVERGRFYVRQCEIAHLTLFITPCCYHEIRNKSDDRIDSTQMRRKGANVCQRVSSQSQYMPSLIIAQNTT